MRPETNHRWIFIIVAVSLCAPAGCREAPFILWDADEDFVPYDPNDEYCDRFPEERRSRVAAFRPGGPYAKILADHKMVVMLGGTLFSHAGVSPEYIDIRTVCDGMLYQIDVGMYFGERAGAIEILGDEIRKVEIALE
jgi:hypothetical protein